MSMAWAISEQVKSWSSWKNCEQVVNEYYSNEIFLKENQENLENLWSSQE